MPVTFEPHKRLEHLSDYISKINLNLPLKEAKIQLMRCRIVAYGLAAEINEPAFSKGYIDQLFAKAYQKLSQSAGEEITDPYLDPCRSQYTILDEMQSYLQRDPDEPFMRFVRAEFKKVFVPTLRLMTDLCPSQNKYSWEETIDQLQRIMKALKVEETWEDCNERLERYMNKIAPLLKRA